MRENLEELRKQFSLMIREERQAFRRLKDMAHKYRAVFQYLSTRSKTMEEKLNHLISYRDEAKSSFDSAQLNLRLVRAKVRRVSDKIDEVRESTKTLVTQYNELLDGKLPPPLVEEKEAMADIRAKKENFIARLSEAFADLEQKIAETTAETDKLEHVKNKLSATAQKLSEKAKMEETRLALFNSNIRELLMEMNAEEGNVRQLMDDYSKLEKLMEKAPDISAWGMKVFKESVKAELPPGSAILELVPKTPESPSPSVN